MSNPFYRKDEKFICKHCKSLIAIFDHDVFSGDRIDESLFKEVGGQAPWKNYDITDCRNCGKNFYEQLKQGHNEQVNT